MAKEFVIKNGLIINDTHVVTGITNNSALTFNEARLVTEDAIKKYIENNTFWSLSTNVLSPESSSYSVDIENTTSSTSTVTGALTVAGGVGVVENIYAGNIYIPDGQLYIKADTTSDRPLSIDSSEGNGQPLTWYGRRDGYSWYVDVDDETSGNIGNNDVSFFNI
jgi:hypothetical protein